MKRALSCFVLGVLVLVATGIRTSAAAKSHATPAEVVKRAVEAQGGADALRGLERITLTGKLQSWEPEQSYMPGGEMRWTELSTITITRDFPAGAARLDWVRDWKYPFVRTGRYTEILTGGIGFVRGVDYTARPARATKTDPPTHTMSGLRVAAAERELKRTSPRLLLDMMTNGKQLSGVPKGGVDPRYPAVQYQDGGHRFTVMFDPQTNLPARIRVIDTDNIEGDSTSDVVLGDWRAVGGVKIAHRISYELNGQQVGLYEFSQVTANPSLAGDTFAIPAEARGKAAKAATENVPYQWVLRRQAIGVFLDSDAVSYDADASSAGFRLAELAPGIQHVVGGSHNSLIVEMKDYLIVFDAPVGETQSAWTINAAKAKYPGKPIRYIVLTHHHMDHAGGVRTYIAEGATLVVGAPNQAHFERVIKAPHLADNDRLQKATKRPDPTIMEVLTYMELFDGTRRVRIDRIANRHAEGMLIAFIPDAQVGFVTDLWSPVAQTAGNPGQADLLAAVKGLRLDPAVRFAGGHGGVATVADLERLNPPR